MEKFTNEELLEVLPSTLRETKELTNKQKVVLGQMIVYNGLDIAKNDGYFYRSNKDLSADCELQEKTLITAVRKLETLGFIERKKGSRSDGASEYRINEKVIGDFGKPTLDNNCKKDIGDCNIDYSKQIAEMAERIKVLENTVKKLVVRITVIEGRNYSTESDIDKDLEKENNINNNILIDNNINNFLKETDNSKELELEESEGKQTISQNLTTENLSEARASNDETTTIPTKEEKELLTECIKLTNPYLLQAMQASSVAELNRIMDSMSETVNDYCKSVNSLGLTQWVTDTFNERAMSYFIMRSKELEEMHSKQITKQLEQFSQYASYYC